MFRIRLAKLISRYGFIINESGRWLDPQFNIINLDDTVIQNQFAFGYDAGLDICYDLKTVELFVDGRLSQLLKSQSNISSEINLQSRFVEAQLGLRKKI